MKKVFRFPELSLTMLLALVALFSSTICFAQTERLFRNLSYSTIESDGVFNLHLISGNENLVKVVADEDRIGDVKVENRANKLILSTLNNDKKRKSRINLYVTYKTMDKLTLNGVGNVSMDNELKVAKFSINGSSVGNVNLNFKCQDFNADLSGVGNIIFKGFANKATIDFSGTGKILAFGLKTEVLSIDCSGVGLVEVYAEKEISIDCNGVGNVNYKGPAAVKQLSKSGIGSVKHLDD